MRIYVFNVIYARRPGARTHTVALRCVLAANISEALQAVRERADSEEIIRFRNTFEPGECFSWAHQTWTREDVADTLKGMHWYGTDREPAPYVEVEEPEVETA